MPDETHVDHTIAPVATNTQDFSGSDDEIMDNFGDDPNVPAVKTIQVALGMENEIDHNQTQPDEVIPSEDTAEADTAEADTASEQEPAGEDGAGEPPSAEEPEIPQSLLQMAGYSSAEEAKADGFSNTETLFAAIKLRSKSLIQQEQTPVQGLYRPVQPQVQETPPAPKVNEEYEPFQLPEEKLDVLDDDLQEVLRNMNEHNQRQYSLQQQELQTLRNELKQREESLALQQEQNEEIQFDKAVQNLSDWKDVFGEGDGMELARTGKLDPVAMTNFNHRALLFETVQAVREVNAKQGYKPMDLEQEIQYALMQRYPDKFQQIILANSTPPVQRQGVIASRPTQRKTPPKTQNEKTIAAINAMRRKQGKPALTSSGEEEFDGEV